MQNSLDSGIDLLVPHQIELDGDSLLSDTTNPKRLSAKPLAFNKFADYTDPEDDQAILKFARRWGTMGICAAHGLPMSHALIPGGAMLGVEQCWPAKTKMNGAEYYTEPLEFWRHAITKTQALRRIGSDILSGGNGREKDWLAVCGLYIVVGGEPWRKENLAREALAVQVQDWLHIGGVRPNFSWNHKTKQWSICHAAPGGGLWPLFSWLALHLAIEVAGGRGVACPYCQDTYFPERLPSPGQRHCCQKADCRKRRAAEYKREQRGDSKS